MYLPADAQDRLFEQITELCAADSRIAVETAGRHAHERREEMRKRFERISEQVRDAEALDVADLMYDDPDSRRRRRVAGRPWLDRDSRQPSHDEMRRLGRHVEVPITDGDAVLDVRHRRKALNEPLGR